MGVFTDPRAPSVLVAAPSPRCATPHSCGPGQTPPPSSQYRPPASAGAGLLVFLWSPCPCFSSGSGLPLASHTELTGHSPGGHRWFQRLLLDLLGAWKTSRAALSGAQLPVGHVCAGLPLSPRRQSSDHTELLSSGSLRQ